MTRRTWLASTAGVAALAAGYPTLIETRWLEVTLTRVPLARSLPRPIRILQLSDFHASIFVPLALIERSLELGLQQRPDFICLTGDFITDRHGFAVDRYVEALRHLARASHVPVVAVLGNHDGGRWSTKHRGLQDHKLVDSMLNRSEIRLLHNEAMAFDVCGTRLGLVGLGDLWTGEAHPELAFANAATGVPTLVLAHNPDSKELLQPYVWDLMLSGHTHGGQVLIPFEGPRFAPVEDKRYVAGLRAWGARQIYVTRGVGNLGSVRFRCRPEVSLLQLS